MRRNRMNRSRFDNRRYRRDASYSREFEKDFAKITDLLYDLADEYRDYELEEIGFPSDYKAIIEFQPGLFRVYLEQNRKLVFDDGIPLDGRWVKQDFYAAAKGLQKKLKGKLDKGGNGVGLTYWGEDIYHPAANGNKYLKQALSEAMYY